MIAVSVAFLLIPTASTLGGMPGLSILIFYLHPEWEPGIILLLLNLMTLILAFCTIGLVNAGRCIGISIWLSGVIEICNLWEPTPVTDQVWPWIMMLGASVAMGIGLALCVVVGYPPAGTAVISVILAKFTCIKLAFAWLIIIDVIILSVTMGTFGWLIGSRSIFGAFCMYLVYMGTEKKLRPFLIKEDANAQYESFVVCVYIFTRLQNFKTGCIHL